MAKVSLKAIEITSSLETYPVSRRGKNVGVNQSANHEIENQAIEKQEEARYVDPPTGFNEGAYHDGKTS